MAIGPHLEQALNAAVAHHRAGRLAEAEGLYRRVCEQDPNQARAFHLWGVVAHQLGRSNAAALVRRAIALAPDLAEAHNDCGVILASRGALVEAVSCFERAVALSPGYVEARNNLARGLRSLGRFDASLLQFQQALASDPTSPLSHLNLASALETIGRTRDAERHYRQAIAYRPNFVDAHVHLALLLHRSDRLAESLGHAERAVELNPSNPGARNNLGNILHAIGRREDAIAQYEAVLQLDPGAFMAHYNCGVALRGESRIADAREHFARALARKPDFLEAELALCMAELPVLYEDVDEIIACRHAYAGRLSRLSDHVERTDRLAGLAEAIGSHQPFYLPYQGENDRDLQAAYGAVVCKAMATKYPAAALQGAPKRGDKIEVGIVSGFFRQHSNWKIPIRGWLRMLNRDRFQVSGYYTATERDSETDAAAAMCDRFVQGPLSLNEWRRTILENAPHILIYPEIGMDKVSAQLAAQRLATVQCVSWGHPVTSGFPTMDYFISSDAMEPPGADAHYSEQLVRLPNLSIYYEPPVAPVRETSRTELGLEADAIVYWCGQSLPKYLPQFDDVFARIAARVPKAQFAFIEYGGGRSVTELFRRRLERSFTAVQLNVEDHCIFVPRLTPDLFVAAIGQCDLVLDSIGWSGCNSILESLAHNLPIVTFAGKMMRGRHAAAILEMMCITDTIARTVDEYVAIASDLGHAAEKRSLLSDQISRRKHRLYRDLDCIAALEEFLSTAVHRKSPTN